ncbi:exodeoxyribonuclease VII large subunit [Vibrio crassostreae]|nr:exodeoxyribonuclease VII large subunit [Vibrio crassostreae]CAK2876371.1 exodeoxyribonuclease VII large subunit [Vibrio crassostreae]CAK3377404.1 exodeoxyribonuclease VII large subunit [Vibrio crassostreae]CAK3383292.1 exodeoxyribonuclease VII large subunit [Vibrio crassostreae]CAK3387028.1 exodeoxyribonuclease VII large subunit [Vibrio crassostreae]
MVSIAQVDKHSIPSQTLTELLGQVEQVIRGSFNGRHWITAELLNLKQNQSGHVYLQLTDANEGGSESQARAVIWSNRTSIIDAFEKSTQMTFAEGLSILCLVEVQFHTQYGLNLTIVDINPSYTIGAFELKLQSIRDWLVDKREAELNQRLRTPTEFTRVAVIAPKNAAGLSDFRSVAHLLEQHDLCQFDYLYASFQGEARIRTIEMAFTELVQNEHAYDAVCVIRGGGDKAGLNELSEPKLARLVCRCPYPVFTGVGHSTDSVILDEFANQSFATPTKVIDHIKHTIIQNAQSVSASYSTLQNIAQSICKQQRQSITHQKERIGTGQSASLSYWRKNAVELWERLFERANCRVRECDDLVNRQFQHLSANANQKLNSSRIGLNRLQEQVSHQSKSALSGAKSAVLAEQQIMKQSSVAVLMLAKQSVLTHYRDLKQLAEHRVHNHKQVTRQLWLNLSQSSKTAIHIASNQAVAASSSLVMYARMHVQSQQHEIQQDTNVLFVNAKRALSTHQDLVRNDKRLIDAYDPQRVLERGYALMCDDEGHVIKSTQQLQNNQQYTVQLHDGSATVTNHSFQKDAQHEPAN